MAANSEAEVRISRTPFILVFSLSDELKSSIVVYLVIIGNISGHHHRQHQRRRVEELNRRVPAPGPSEAATVGIISGQHQQH